MREGEEIPLAPEKWKIFRTKLQQMIKDESQKNQNTPGNYFYFTNREEISKYQREKTGITFPCTTNNVLEVDMLYGKRFSPSERKEEKIFSSIKAENCVINCNISKTDLTTLSGKTDPNNPILIQLQSRGVGKTKTIYDLGMKQDVIYFDLSCDREGRGSKFAHITTCFSIIAKLIDNADREEVFDKCVKMRAQACIIIEKCIIAGLLHHGIFRQIYPSATPEQFLRYSMNGGVGIIDSVFRFLLDHDITSIREIAKQYDTFNKIFAYDEVGCLTDLFEGKFLGKNVKRDEKISKESFRGLFDVFAQCVLSMREFRSHQVLSGTTISIANLLTLRISAFKREEIAVVTPITPFMSKEIGEIIKYYFPNLQFDSRITSRWAGRGRFIMQYFVQNLIKTATAQKSTNLQESFNSQEPLWYESAVACVGDYIQGYLDIEMATGTYQHKKPVSEILEFIYHDCVMRRKGKKYTLSYEQATNLVQQGIMFLPSTFKEKDFEIQMFQEVISFDALGQYFQSIREEKGNILEDPILKLCYTELKQEAEGSGYVWEDCFSRFVMLNLQPKIGTRESIEESSIMKEFCAKDATLRFYTLEAQYVADYESSGKTWIGYLKSGDTTNVHFPDQFAGPDACVPLAKLTFQECLKIDRRLSQGEYDELPKIRILLIQDKFLTTGDALGDMEHALQTCDLSKCYLGKKKEDSEKSIKLREDFETFLKKEGQEIANWSIGLLCVAGSVPNKFDQRLIVKSPHQLIGCITPISFDFKGDLQELLMKSCKLSDKGLKNQVEQLFLNHKYGEIMDKMEECLEMLTMEKLDVVGKELYGENGKRKRDTKSQRLKTLKKTKK